MGISRESAKEYFSVERINKNKELGSRLKSIRLNVLKFHLRVWGKKPTRLKTASKLTGVSECLPAL